MSPRRPVSSGTGAPPPRRADPVSSTAPAPPARPEPSATGPVPAPGDWATSARAPAETPPRRAPAAPAAVVVAPDDAAPPSTQRSSRRSNRDRRRIERGAPWWLRVLAWVVAVPAGLVIVGLPARKLGYLSSQKLLDIVIETDSRRYVPLAVIVLLWALVTAVLVQVIADGGGWLLRRRAAKRVAAADVGSPAG